MQITNYYVNGSRSVSDSPMHRFTIQGRPGDVMTLEWDFIPAHHSRIWVKYSLASRQLLLSAFSRFIRQQPQGTGTRRCLDTGMHAQLRENIADMAFDGID